MRIESSKYKPLPFFSKGSPETSISTPVLLMTEILPKTFPLKSREPLSKCQNLSEKPSAQIAPKIAKTKIAFFIFSPKRQSWILILRLPFFLASKSSELQKVNSAMQNRLQKFLFGGRTTSVRWCKLRKKKPRGARLNSIEIIFRQDLGQSSLRRLLRNLRCSRRQRSRFFRLSS